MMKPEFRDVETFVTGAVVQYWVATIGSPLSGDNFERYLRESIAKVWAYLSEDRSTGDFTDLQCSIGLRLRALYQLYK